MRICIATYATGNFAPVCDVTDPNKAEYASLHGYGFERNHNEAFHTGNPNFDRHRWHVELLKSGRWDWMYFLDADAIFTNFDKRLEDIILPDDHLIFPIDAVMVQAGGFLARNSDVTFRFFDELQKRKTEVSDQIEMERILPDFSGSYKIIPQRTLGSYDYKHYQHLGGNYVTSKDRDGNDGQWQPGDFVFHCPGMTIANKVDVLRSKLAVVKAFANSSGRA